MTLRMTARLMKRSWQCATALAAVLYLAAVVSGAEAATKTKSKLKDMKIPAKTRFIDVLGVKALATDQADIDSRFNDGPTRIPGKAPVLNAPLWVRNMRADVNEFTEYYTGHTNNPAPPPGQLPIFVVRSDEINCMVVREDYDLAGRSANTGGLGFLDSAYTQAPTSSAVNGGQAPNADKPSPIEMLCTDAAIHEIGGLHFGVRDTEGDSQMAFIIGHELSHILLGHYKVQEAQVKRQKELGTLFRVSAVLLTLINSKYSRSGSQINISPTPQASKDLTKLLLVTYAVDEFNVVVMGPKWQREQERQADLLSIDMMKGVNERASVPVWQPAAALHYIDRVEKAEKDRKKKSNFGEQLAAVVGQGLLTGLSDNNSGDNLISSLATRVAILAYLRWREANLARLHDYSD